MPSPNSEDNTTDKRSPETSTRTDIGAQNMPSATAFAETFSASLAPVLSQLTNLNKKVSSVLLDGQDEPNEDGETASGDGPAKTADMDVDLSALLASAGKDDSNEAILGNDLLKELAQDLTVSEKTSLPLREGLVAILKNLLSEKMGTRSSRPNLKNILVLRMSRPCEHQK